jgi:hypothetical protein
MVTFVVTVTVMVMVMVRVTAHCHCGVGGAYYGSSLLYAGQGTSLEHCGSAQLCAVAGV